MGYKCIIWNEWITNTAPNRQNKSFIFYYVFKTPIRSIT